MDDFFKDEAQFYDDLLIDDPHIAREAIQNLTRRRAVYPD
jgi:hypothetical protein